MKEIVIMIGPTGPDQKLIDMLKKLFPECAIRFVHAGSSNVSPKGDTSYADMQHTKNR